MRTFETLEMSARCNTGFEEKHIFDDEPYRKESTMGLDIDNKQENQKIRTVEPLPIIYTGKSQKLIF